MRARGALEQPRKTGALRRLDSAVRGFQWRRRKRALCAQATRAKRAPCAAWILRFVVFNGGAGNAPFALSTTRAKRAPRAAWILRFVVFNGGAGNTPFALSARRAVPLHVHAGGVPFKTIFAANSGICRSCRPGQADALWDCVGIQGCRVDLARCSSRVPKRWGGASHLSGRISAGRTVPWKSGALEKG